MTDIEEKLNEMEQRHAAEIKALREELKNSEDRLFKVGDPLLGGMFRVREIFRDCGLIRVMDTSFDHFTFGAKQQEQLKAIEGIITAARESSLRSVNVAFLKAKELGLKF